IQQNERCVLCGAECVKKQCENQHDTYRYDQGQSFHRPLLVLELSTPGNVITRRELDLLVDAIAHFLDETSHVAVFDELANSHYTSAELAADVHTSFADSDSCQLVEWYALAVGCVHENIADVCHLPPSLL